VCVFHWKLFVCFRPKLRSSVAWARFHGTTSSLRSGLLGSASSVGLSSNLNSYKSTPTSNSIQFW
jgi:hypothetical protein